jgi:D-methionine transport system ATP-binding protein
MAEPIISIQHLRKAFRSSKMDVEAIRDVSIDIERGEIYGIIGLSGAGKSTLVRCINTPENRLPGMFSTRSCPA